MQSVNEQDSLIPDPEVAKEFGISLMSLWRWDRDPDLGFPPRIKIRRRNYRSRRGLDQFKAKMLRGALVRKPRERSAR